MSTVFTIFAVAVVVGVIFVGGMVTYFSRGSS